MDSPLQVSFHGVPHSDALEARIHKEVAKLERHHKHIVGCRVTVEAPHKRHAQGNLFAIHIVIDVPGRTLVVKRSPDGHKAHEDPYVAARDAFREAARQLQDNSQKVRGKVKHHDAPPVGQVTRVFPQDGYGFIQTMDGREVYFHENSLVDAAFDDVEVGRRVRYHEEDGDDGPQASTVHLLG